MLPDADGADAGGVFPAARRNRTVDCVHTLIHALLTPIGRTVDGRLRMIYADERKVKQVLLKSALHMRYPISPAGNANGRFRTRKEVCEGPLLCCPTGGNGSTAAPNSSPIADIERNNPLVGSA